MRRNQAPQIFCQRRDARKIFDDCFLREPILATAKFWGFYLQLPLARCPLVL